MDTNTIIIIVVAALALVALLLLLARTGRKTPEGPAAGVTPIDHGGPTPIISDQPLPEPGTATISGIAPSDFVAGPSAPPPANVVDGPTDPLTRMKGLGPKAEATLNAFGITRYAQIAAWSEADIAAIDSQMGAFRGRIARDRWVEQAGYLSAGDTAGFEAVFGKLG